MRSGDVVKHRPSGETWVVAVVDEDELMPAGWPLSVAKVADCDILREATAEESADMLRKVATGGTDHLGGDRRRRIARRQLELDRHEHACAQCHRRRVCYDGCAVITARGELLAIAAACYDCGGLAGHPSAYEDVKRERRAQVEQWGGPAHDDEHAVIDWLRFLDKQEAAAFLCAGRRDVQGYRAHMIKVAALAIAAVESIDRKAIPEPTAEGRAV